MPISAKKFNTFTFNHRDQVDNLYTVKTTDEIKTAFDSRAEAVRVSLVGLIDNLLSTAPGDSGASNIATQPIEGLPGATVYDVLISIKNALNNVTLGNIPDNTIINAKLYDDIKIGSLALLQTIARDSVISAINEVLARLTTNINTTNLKLDASEVVTTATANKILRLNAFSKFDASISGDAGSVNGKTATGTLSTLEKTNLLLAINEVFNTLGGKSATGTLTTTEKTNLVTALNELVTSIGTKVATSQLSTGTGANSVAQMDVAGTLTANQFKANFPTGTAPMTTTSTTLVTNFNADMVDGLNADVNATANTVMARDASGNSNANQINFTAPQGTAPFTVNSTTKVTNLNAELLGSYWPSSFAKTTQEANINPTLLNSWVNLGGADSAVAYHKDTMGYVHIQGTIKTGAVGTSVFVLPAGYRPLESQNFGTCCSGNYAVIRVANDGTVSVSVGSSSWTSLNGITFRAGN